MTGSWKFKIALGFFFVCLGLLYGTGASAEGQMPIYDHDMRFISWDTAQTATPSGDQLPAGEEAENLRIDLWLDSTPNFGGMNTVPGSIFSYGNRRHTQNHGYQGGFHYAGLDEAPAGWYASVLQSILAASEPNYMLRILRYGNEYISEQFLQEMGITVTQANIASVRRDMMTYAVTRARRPSDTLLDGMVSRSMEDSFYSTGSAANNRLGMIHASDLENPSLRDAMIRAQGAFSDRLQGEADMHIPYLLNLQPDNPMTHLLYALETMDLGSLNIIITDTIDLKALEGPVDETRSAAYYRDLLVARGVFAQHDLSIGMIACMSDYMGYITGIGGEQLAEAFRWGRWQYRQDSDGSDIFNFAAAAPRPFLILLIGPAEYVEPFMARLTDDFDRKPAFTQAHHGLNRERSENRDVRRSVTEFMFGDTVFSLMDFHFDYRTHIIRSTSITAAGDGGAGITLSDGSGGDTSGGITQLTVLPSGSQTYPDETIRIEMAMGEADGARRDASRIVASVGITQQLTLEEVADNVTRNLETYESVPGAQVVPLRDKLLIYRRRGAGGEALDGTMPFSLVSQEIQDDTLVLTIAVDGSLLRQGYYRLQVNVGTLGGAAWRDLPRWMLDSPTVRFAPKVAEGEEPLLPYDAGETWNYTPLTENLMLWTYFAQTIAQEEQSKKAQVDTMQHAWGVRTYHGMEPNIPPVFKVFNLYQLALQFQSAASETEQTFAPLTFDVFVSNTP